MDRTERLLNNRPSRRMIGLTVLLLLLSVLAAWVISGHLAGRIVAHEISAMLSVQGGGSFTQAASPAHIAQGEALLREYGVSAQMDPRLMEDFGSIRRLLFGCMAAVMAAVCIVFCITGVAEADRTSRQLEALRSDCAAIADLRQEAAALQDVPFSSVHRVCESVNLIAERMQWANLRVGKEKAFLRDFLTDFSHQIKNTLAGVRLTSDMLSELDRLTAAQRDALTQEMNVQLDEMEQLTVSALQLARLNADAVQYELTECSLSDTCRTVLDREAPLLREHGIQAELQASDDGILLHDPGWMGEAIANLVKNAADHAQCRRIILHVETIPGAVKLIVEDDGRGIPQAEIPHLFERFGHKRKGTGVKSVGIGLAITRQIVEAHGGSVTVYSEPGKGTQFEMLFLKGFAAGNNIHNSEHKNR